MPRKLPKEAWAQVWIWCGLEISTSFQPPCEQGGKDSEDRATESRSYGAMKSLHQGQETELLNTAFYFLTDPPPCLYPLFPFHCFSYLYLWLSFLFASIIYINTFSSFFPTLCHVHFPFWPGLLNLDLSWGSCIELGEPRKYHLQLLTWVIV